MEPMKRPRQSTKPWTSWRQGQVRKTSSKRGHHVVLYGAYHINGRRGKHQNLACRRAGGNLTRTVKSAAISRLWRGCAGCSACSPNEPPRPRLKLFRSARTTANRVRLVEEAAATAVRDLHCCTQEPRRRGPALSHTSNASRFIKLAVCAEPVTPIPHSVDPVVPQPYGKALAT